MKAGSEAKPLFFKSPLEYRAWLEKHHESATELWIGFWKKSTGKPSLTWQQCVDESLCFGWIDGIRKSIDADCYKQRVTPRRPTSIWSEINVRRVGELTAEGRMRPAGTAAFQKLNRTKVYAYENFRKPLGPAEEAKFRKNKKAWAFFETLPPSYKRTITWWVMSAKQEATRQRRLETLIRDSEAGRRTGAMTTKKQEAGGRKQEAGKERNG